MRAEQEPILHYIPEWLLDAWDIPANPDLTDAVIAARDQLIVAAEQIDARRSDDSRGCRDPA